MFWKVGNTLITTPETIRAVQLTYEAAERWIEEFGGRIVHCSGIGDACYAVVK